MSFAKFFKNVKIKSGRSKENWCKSTQRYYGLSLKIEENLTQIVEFTNILNFLPPDYFVTSKTLTQIQIGHFTGEIVNSNKLMLEINLQADGYFSLFFMVKKLCLHKTGLQNNYSLSTQSIASLFKILGQLRYCQGLSSVDKNLPHFVEHVSVVGNENSEKLRYRNQNCLKVLPFKTSDGASETCLFCKKLKDHVKPDKKTDEFNLKEEDSDEVVLGESGHKDLSKILQTILLKYNNI